MKATLWVMHGPLGHHFHGLRPEGQRRFTNYCEAWFWCSAGGARVSVKRWWCQEASA